MRSLTCWEREDVAGEAGRPRPVKSKREKSSDNDLGREGVCASRCRRSSPLRGVRSAHLKDKGKKERAHGGCLWLSEATKDVTSCEKPR